MRYNSVITFRADEGLARRIDRFLGVKYRTRTGFIRTAVEEMLAREERGRPVIPTIEFY
jgi:predicted transcriptional regulator